MGKTPTCYGISRNNQRHAKKAANTIERAPNNSRSNNASRIRAPTKEKNDTPGRRDYSRQKRGVGSCVVPTQTAPLIPFSEGTAKKSELKEKRVCIAQTGMLSVRRMIALNALALRLFLLGKFASFIILYFHRRHKRGPTIEASQALRPVLYDLPFNNLINSNVKCSVNIMSVWPSWAQFAAKSSGAKMNQTLKRILSKLSRC